MRRISNRKYEKTGAFTTERADQKIKAKTAQCDCGNTSFRFKVADFVFDSTSYDWLVIAGPKAQFKGVGSINGEGEYGFMLTAIDGDLPGGGGEHKFRIKIWDRETGNIVYDNMIDSPDDADPTTIITKGVINIQKN